MEIISEETGDSPKQVQRYIKMSDLIPELLEKVDDGSMGFTPAVQIAYLKKKEQGTYFYIHCSLCHSYLNDIVLQAESWRKVNTAFINVIYTLHIYNKGLYF